MTTPTDPSTDSYAERRLEELEKEIPRIDTAMGDAPRRIEEFVEHHQQQRTAFANGLVVGRIGAMELRHADLRSLENELNSLVARFHAALKEFADLKGKLINRRRRFILSRW